MHMGRHSIELSDSRADSIDMIDHERHSYVDIGRFQPPNRRASLSLQAHFGHATYHESVVPNLYSTSTTLSQHTSSWSSVRHLVDRVQHHAYGHASYCDIRTLLMRSNLWNAKVRHYLETVVAQSLSCSASTNPPPNHKVSLASLNASFNDVICTDHIHIGSVTLLHAEDLATRVPAASAVQSVSLDDSIASLESCWMAPFWPPTSLLCDGVFQKNVFRNFVAQYNTTIQHVPPRRHEKTQLNQDMSPFVPSSFVSRAPPSSQMMHSG